MSLLDVLTPAEPIVSGFAAPRLISFADPDEPGYKHAGKISKGIIHTERVRLINAAMIELGGECMSSHIAAKTDLEAPVVSRILQLMRREGLVSSRRIPGSTSRMWVLL